MLLSTVKLPVPSAVNAPVPVTAPFKVAKPLLSSVRLSLPMLTPARDNVVPVKIVSAPKVTLPV